MARKPIGKVAMTPAERQRRRRKRLKAEQLKTATKAERKRQRLKNAAGYIPMDDIVASLEATEAS